MVSFGSVANYNLQIALLNKVPNDERNATQQVMPAHTERLNHKNKKPKRRSEG
jgi:hypothetical protein